MNTYPPRISVDYDELIYGSGGKEPNNGCLIAALLMIIVFGIIAIVL